MDEWRQICTGELMSKIEADQVDVPTTGIPKVKSIEGGAVKTADLKTALGVNASEL